MSSRLGRGQPNRPILIRVPIPVLAQTADATTTRTRTVTADASGQDPKPAEPIVVAEGSRAAAARRPVDATAMIVRGVLDTSAAVDATVTRTRAVTATASRSDTADATVTRTRSVTAAASSEDPARPRVPIVVSEPSRSLAARRPNDVVTVVVPPVEISTGSADATVTRTRAVTSAASSVDPVTARPVIVVTDAPARAASARGRLVDPVQFFAGMVTESTGSADAAVTRTRTVTASASVTDPVMPAGPVVVADAVGAAYRARLVYDPVTVVVPPVEVGGAATANATATRTRAVTAAASRSDAAAASVTRTRSVTASGTTATVGNATATRTRAVTAAASANSPLAATLTRVRAVTATADVLGAGGKITGRARASGPRVTGRAGGVPQVTGRAGGGARITGRPR